jgi:Na+/H+-dicarboxylate symporter
MIKRLAKLPLWAKVLIGLLLGVAAGFALGPEAEKLKPVGTLFIRAVKMLIVPLIFSSLMVGLTSIKDLKKMGRIGLKTFLFYLISTAGAVILGIVLCEIIKPGAGMALKASSDGTKEVTSLADMFLNIIPDNPVNALATGNVLQIIAFVVFLGIAVNLAGNKGQIIADFCEGLAETMYKLTDIIMSFAPIGVFALIGAVVGSYGAESVLYLAKLIGVVYLGCIIQMVVVFGLAIVLMCGLNPAKFFKGSFDAILLAFSASSSSVALPVSMRCAEENLGVSKNIFGFTLPLGATINMDGTAIYQGVCAVFVAQAYGVPLTFTHYATIVIITCLAAIGTAGIPGAGVIMLSLVLNSAGLPLDGVAIVMGVDRILDMARTAVNVTGDLVATVWVAKTEKEFSVDIYNSAPEI